MDFTNSLFQFVSSLLVWLSAWSVKKDRGYAGVHLYQLIFLVTWGLWDTVYYSSLGHWYSFFASISSVSSTLCWLILAAKYGKISNPE